MMLHAKIVNVLRVYIDALITGYALSIASLTFFFLQKKVDDIPQEIIISTMANDFVHRGQKREYTIIITTTWNPCTNGIIPRTPK